MNSMEVLYVTFGRSLTFVKFETGFSTSHTFNSSDRPSCLPSVTERQFF